MQVFISYRNDQARMGQRARRLVAALQAKGWQVWWDKEAASDTDAAERAMAAAREGRAAVWLCANELALKRAAFAPALDEGDPGIRVHDPANTPPLGARERSIFIVMPKARFAPEVWTRHDAPAPDDAHAPTSWVARLVQAAKGGGAALAQSLSAAMQTHALPSARAIGPTQLDQTEYRDGRLTLSAPHPDGVGPFRHFDMASARDSMSWYLGDGALREDPDLIKFRQWISAVAGPKVLLAPFAGVEGRRGGAAGRAKRLRHGRAGPQHEADVVDWRSARARLLLLREILERQSQVALHGQAHAVAGGGLHAVRRSVESAPFTPPSPCHRLTSSGQPEMSWVDGGGAQVAAAGLRLGVFATLARLVDEATGLRLSRQLAPLALSVTGPGLLRRLLQSRDSETNFSQQLQRVLQESRAILVISSNQKDEWRLVSRQRYCSSFVQRERIESRNQLFKAQAGGGANALAYVLFEKLNAWAYSNCAPLRSHYCDAEFSLRFQTQFTQGFWHHDSYEIDFRESCSRLIVFDGQDLETCLFLNPVQRVDDQEVKPPA